MRRIGFILIFFVSNATGQTFWNFYGYGWYFDCLPTSNDCYIAAGNDLVKVDASGDTIWTNQTPFCYPHAIVEDAFGNFIMAGLHSISTSGSSYEPTIAKTDPAGNQIWHKVINTSWWSSAQSMDIAINRRGKYVVTWKTESQAADINVAGTDTSGQILWSHSYNIFDSESTYGMDLDRNDNIYLAGTSVDSLSNYTGFVAKTDSNGILTHSRSLLHVGTDGSNIEDVFYLSNSAVYATGEVILGSTPPEARIWIVRLNSNLDTLKSIILDKQVNATKIAYDSATAYLYFVAYGADPGDTNQNVCIIRCDTSMLNFSMKVLDSTSVDMAFSIHVVDSGRLLIAGGSNYTPERWLLLTDTNGFVPVSPYILAVNDDLTSVKLNCFYSDRAFGFQSAIKIKSAKIFSRTGALMSDRNFNSLTGEFRINLNAGIYYVSFETTDHRIISREFAVVE